MSDLQLNASEEFRRLRVNAGLTQQELADDTGISRAQVANLESGRYGLTLDTASALSRALGTSFWRVLRRLDP